MVTELELPEMVYKSNVIRNSTFTLKKRKKFVMKNLIKET